MKKGEFKIEEFVRPNIAKLKAYSSARDEFEEATADVTFLDANENPFQNGVNRYPDPKQQSVKELLSKIKGVPTSQMLLGNGSDEVLDLIFRAFCEPKEENVICTPPTYGMYKVLAELNDIELRKAVLKEDFSLDVEGVFSQIDGQTKLIFLCSPNNPTGNLIPQSQVEEILENSNCLVVIDEAYIDFSDGISWSLKLDHYPNLIVCQTLSKAWGMAAIRLGICYASQEIISVLNKIKPPYNVNSLTQEKALEFLKDEKSFQKKLQVILLEKERMKVDLKKILFIEKIYPSDANFWLIKVDDANKRYAQLLEKGVVVRNRTNETLCENCLRITIGTREENEKLLEVLKDIE